MVCKPSAKAREQDQSSRRRRASSAEVRFTVWLLLLLVATHYGYDYAPNRWAAFGMGLGALSAVLLWEIRGPLFKARWWLCLWGAFEGWQIFVCQGLQNWVSIEFDRFHGACESFFSLPTYAWGMGAAAFIAGLIASEATNGH